MVTRISSVHRLEFFPHGYSSKLKKKIHMSAQQGKSIHSLTYCITIDKLPSESLLLFCRRQKHMKELSTSARRHEFKCQNEWAR